MKRPTGITILAVLLFSSAGLKILSVLAYFLGGHVFGSFAHRMAGGPTPTIQEIVVPLIGAGLQIWIGYGLWTLQSWARMLLIVLSALNAVWRGLLIIIVVSAHLHMMRRTGGATSLEDPLAIFVNLLIVGIEVLIFAYLLMPNTKKTFAATEYTL